MPNQADKPSGESGGKSPPKPAKRAPNTQFGGKSPPKPAEKRENGRSGEKKPEISPKRRKTKNSARNRPKSRRAGGLNLFWGAELPPDADSVDAVDKVERVFHQGDDGVGGTRVVDKDSRPHHYRRDIDQ